MSHPLGFGIFCNQTLQPSTFANVKEKIRCTVDSKFILTFAVEYSCSMCVISMIKYSECGLVNQSTFRQNGRWRRGVLRSPGLRGQHHLKVVFGFPEIFLPSFYFDTSLRSPLCLS